MADDIEEVTTSSERSAPYPKKRPPGLSPLATGLLYGGAATAIAGPIGLLAGLAYGIASNRSRESYLDSVARESYNSRIRFDGVNDQIKQELQIADPDEARLLRSAQQQAAQGWQILQSGDPSGRELIEQAYATTQGIMNADIQARKAEQASQFNAQRGLITSAAPTLRDQYSNVINQVRDADSRAQRIFELVSDPTFDPDKPFSKSVLTELVSSSLGGLFKEDPNGLLNGIAELGSSGSEIGTIIAAIAKGGKAIIDTDEFKVSREEYNRIALNIRQVTQQYGQKRLQEIGQQAAGLDNWARSVGVIPGDYSLRDYVSGGVSELQVAPAVSIPSVQPLGNNQQPPIRQRQPSWQQQPQQRSVGPQRRTTRPQLQAAPLQPTPGQVLTPQDDWARELLGLPTSSQRRPTN